MKKTLVLLLAVVFAVPAFAGNIFSNLNTRGEIETIGYNTNGYVGDISNPVNAGQKSVANQALFGMSMDLVEDVRANLTFAYTNVWADWNGDTIDTYLNRIRVAEANVVVSNIFGAIETKFGRQYYGEEDSPVMYIGPRHNYYLYMNDIVQMSLDGALATWQNDSAAVSALYAQGSDLSENRLTGLTFDYAFTNNLTAGVYWYDISSSGTSSHVGIWGGKAAYENEGSKLAVEYAKNYKNGVFSHNNEGWMLKADAALNLDMDALALTPRVTYYHEEKGFIALGNYSAGIIVANMVGPFGFENSEDYRVFNAGMDFTFKAMDKVTFAFDYLNLKQDNHWRGNEFDLTAKYQHNDYVSFTLGGGLATNTDNPDGDIYGVQVGMLVKF